MARNYFDAFFILFYFKIEKFYNPVSQILMPDISVLLPLYNPVDVGPTIQSILNQSHKNFELLICDDAPNESFKAAITRRFYESGLEDRLSLHIEPVDELHTKAITGTDFVLDGSMNFTRNGATFFKIIEIWNAVSEIIQ